MPLLFLIGKNIFTIKYKIYLRNYLSISRIRYSLRLNFGRFFILKNREIALWIL